VELVAAALSAQGLRASSQDTGGGICCVVVERKGGGKVIWGTADFNWGASVIDEKRGSDLVHRDHMPKRHD